jgi:hypothetical protein
VRLAAELGFDVTYETAARSRNVCANPLTRMRTWTRAKAHMSDRNQHAGPRRSAFPALTLAVVAVTAAATVGAGLTSAATTASPVASTAGSGGPPGASAGPPYQFKTELMSYAPNKTLTDQVILARTKHGYRLWSGKQSSQVTVSVVHGKLHFRDTRTQSFKKISAKCKRQRVKVGVSALCKIPQGISVHRPLLPRYGRGSETTTPTRRLCRRHSQ